MKFHSYRLVSIVLVLSVVLSACNKKNETEKKLRGQYTYVGSCHVFIDSTFITDTATGATDRIVIDSTYDQVASVFADEQDAFFDINSGLFPFHARFPADGPYFYNSHFSLSYRIDFVGDSLYFEYNNHYLQQTSLNKVVKFAGKKL